MIRTRSAEYHISLELNLDFNEVFENALLKKGCKGLALNYLPLAIKVFFYQYL
jgi:hypothetical protein